MATVEQAAKLNVYRVFTDQHYEPLGEGGICGLPGGGSQCIVFRYVSEVGARAVIAPPRMDHMQLNRRRAFTSASGHPARNAFRKTINCLPAGYKTATTKTANLACMIDCSTVRQGFFKAGMPPMICYDIGLYDVEWTVRALPASSCSII